ncbi:short-chain dehydrogenase/reductase [Alcaligenes sp. DN25]|uniref:short-chain dehydrogenase/reductase n=1 Tax=Alcaligenes TaxID=507 RepID=UPI00202E9DA1|nr:MULTISPECIES: short-chain dehydrogenase/reductase [Alcaligenes]URW83158.1 short-chain dehydrogenase/reductase [Alcaligenes sp. DN25]WEA67988.1 short-chain dehydrogenase/reductase [Alcaligenes faecalis]
MELGLNGKTALITGASQGIGEAIAEALGKEGCHLVLAARSLPKLEHIADRISEQFGVRVQTIAIDLTGPDACDALMQQVGTINILVNNAGAIPSGALGDVTGHVMQRAMGLKLFAYKRLAELAFEHMRINGNGVILNVIGTAGERARAAYALGSMVNASLIAMTRALGLQASVHGVRVVGLHPGATLTKRKLDQLRQRATDQFGQEEEWPALAAQYPFGRLAKAEEIAACAAFLCSTAASYVNATCLTVDGGATDSIL